MTHAEPFSGASGVDAAHLLAQQPQPSRQWRASGGATSSSAASAAAALPPPPLPPLHSPGGASGASFHGQPGALPGRAPAAAEPPHGEGFVVGASPHTVTTFAGGLVTTHTLRHGEAFGAAHDAAGEARPAVVWWVVVGPQLVVAGI